MRTTRKLLALLLAVAMVFTMTAMTALATGGDDDLTTPDGGTTAPGDPATPDGDLTAPGDPTPDGGASTTPDGGASTTPGDPATPKVSADAQAVIALIEALPTSDTILAAVEAGTFDLVAFEAKVSEARVAYDALSDTDKASVGDISSRLTEAEKTLAQLESISLLGTEFVCETEDGNQYETLEAAVAAVKPDETAIIKMLTDVTLNKSVTLPNGVTLDLNGKTISGAMADTITIAANAIVTITDNVGGGKISNSNRLTTYSGAVKVEDGATLTLEEGVTLEATGNNPASLYIKNKITAPTVEIKNAKFISRSYSIRLQGSSYGATINIHDGEFQPGKQSFILNNDAAAVSISGGTFTKWDDDDIGLLAANKVAVVGGEGVTIGDIPTTYAQMGEKYYLTSNDLYDLIKRVDVTGKTIQIVNDVSCTYHDGSYFGNSKGNAKTLTLEIAEGKTLSGKMPLGIAEVTVTGSGTLGENFFVPATENYEVIESSPSTGGKLYTGKVKVENAAAFVIRDGASYAYTSVPAAIEVARTKPGSTVKLNQNYTTNTPVQDGVADFQLWTLDLNGHTYTYTGSAQAFDIRYTKKSFRLTDSSETGGGKLIVTGSDPNAVAIRCEGGSNENTITIKEGVTVEGTILIGGENNTLDVYGTIAATGNKKTAIQTNGSSTKNSTITLRDGAIVTSNSCAIYHPGTGTLNVYKATVTGGEGFTGIEMRAGTLNVYEGAKITGGKGEPDSNPNGSGTTTNNAAIAVAQHNTGEEIKINIEGGTFTGGAAFYESNPQKNEEEAIKLVKMNVSGGEFIGEVSSQDVTGFITGGKFSTDVKKYIKNQYDQLVTDKGTTPFWVDKYSDRDAADAVGQTVYKVTYHFENETVDVYYMTEAEAEEAIKKAGDNVETKEPVAVTPTPSGGGGGSGSYRPVILSPVWNQTVSVIEHGTLTMSVRASGASSYQWYVDRGDGRFVAIAGATGPSLTIWPDMGDHGNRYYCRAMNGYGGVDSHYFTLCVVRSTLPPKTGDQVCVTLWVCLMALGVAGVLAALNRQRNR